VPISFALAFSCLGIAAALLRRAPAVSVALFGCVLGGTAGFLVGNADGPSGVPAATVLGASLGLLANGLMGLLATSARPPSRPLRRAALFTVIAAVPIAGALTAIVQVACPLYVSGRRTGFCNYQQVDQLGGWLGGVAVAFAFDVWFVTALLFVAARQALRSEDATDPKWRRLTSSTRG
jgi:hypothetical protein